MIASSLVCVVAAVAQIAEPAPEASRRDYQILAGPLAEVLPRFAAAAAVALSFDPVALAGVRSDGLNGSFTVAEGFERLLRGSGHQLVASGEGRYTLRALPAPGAPAVTAAGAGAGNAPVGAVQVMPVVEVTAGSLVEGLTDEHAGGQVARGGSLGLLGNRDLMDTPFNQTSYASSLLENQHAQHIADVLANDPTARADIAPSSGLDNFNIRGFDLSNQDVRFGGVAGVAPSFFNSMMSESAERVEVIKGPNALLSGAAPSGGVGGTINVVPKRAPYRDLAQVTVDSANTRVGGHADIGQRFGAAKRFGVRFNGVYRDGDTAVDRQSRKSLLAALALDYQGRALRLSSDLGYQDQEVRGTRRFSSVAAGVAVPDAPSSRVNFFDPFEFTHPEVFYGAARAEADLATWLTATLAIGGSLRNHTYSSSNRSITDALGTVAAGNSSLAADRMTTGTVEGGLRAEFATGGLQHQAVLAHSLLGRNWKRLRVNFAYGASNIYNPTFGPDPAPALFPTVDDARKMHYLSLSSTALADTMSLLDERIQLTVGGRLQNIDSTGFDTATGKARPGYDRYKLTPMAALVVKPWVGVSFYGNYVEGLQEGPIAPDTATNAGQVFDPYVARQVELGIKRDFGTFTSTLAVYQVAKPNALVEPGSGLFTVDGQQRHRGLDFNLFGQLAWFRLLGGAAFIDSELTRTAGGMNQGNTGVGVARTRFVLGAEWDVPFISGLTLTSRVLRTGSVYINPDNSQEVPAWTTLSAGARYATTMPGQRQLTFRAGLDNLLDAGYWEASGSQIGQGDPRRISLSVALEL